MNFLRILTSTKEKRIFRIETVNFLIVVSKTSLANIHVSPQKYVVTGSKLPILHNKKKYSTATKPLPHLFVKKRKKLNKKRTDLPLGQKPFHELIGVLEKHSETLNSKSLGVEPELNIWDHGSDNSYANEVLETSEVDRHQQLHLPAFCITDHIETQARNDVDEHFIGDNHFDEADASSTVFHAHCSPLPLEHVEPEAMVEEPYQEVHDHVELPKAKTVSKKKSKPKSDKKSKLSQKDISLEQKREEILRNSKEMNFNISLLSYIDVCLSADMMSKALAAFKCYVHCRKLNGNYSQIKNAGVYNMLLHGCAAKGNLKQLKYVLDVMKEAISPNLQSYAAYLECLARSKRFDRKEGQKVLEMISTQNLDLRNILITCKFLGDQQEKVLKAIKLLLPDFQPNPVTFPKEYDCKLLMSLNEDQNRKFHSSVEGISNYEDLKVASQLQFSSEMSQFISVKSVFETKSHPNKIQFSREKLAAFEKEWRKAATKAFHHNLKVLRSQSQVQKRMQIYPYLTVLDTDCYIDIVMQEIKNVAESSETYSITMTALHRNVGFKAMNYYLAKLKEKSGYSEKLNFLYSKYLKYCTDKEMSSSYNPRECWQFLKSTHLEGPSMDYPFVQWPYHVQVAVGRFIYDIILHDIRVDLNTWRANAKTKKLTPAFYSIFRHYDEKIKQEIKPHPLLSKLYREAASDNLDFHVTILPMLCPPVPWTNPASGGFLLADTDFVRLPGLAQQQRKIIRKTPIQQLYPSCDSLNALAVCPWIVNKPILDLIIEVFNNNGSKELEIPQPSSILPVPVITATMNGAEKAKAIRERAFVKRKRGEMFSLWCNSLYKFSIANHVRDCVFWFPQNMDFRGRVYPTPPHFNHLGNDTMRSIMLFARGEPLGKNGLDWLKIHLVNLTGLKKRDSKEDRLKYANGVLPDILDSADYPLDGKKWWQNSDNPWQTLACCKEIANAIRSPDPEKYICHFHVHQDGSCNGLQHYAALGRDQHGAEQVNLHPSNCPQDVYSGVAELVERERAKDAAAGVPIAKILEGHVKRKVIKQTVMTVVYGVTSYGAKYQILKQLKDLDDFPQQHAWHAAIYLVEKTFASIHEMFTATRQIQNWFTECAQMISKNAGRPVEWITPLGFPIVQPYHKASLHKTPTQFSDKLPQIITKSNMFDRPNTLKQKNAFPPNFIHSLDSCHMMLTSIFCQRKQITFVSVHDCYWTHPNHVDIMGQLCREQFVALHSEPILEDLSKFLVQTFCNEGSGQADHSFEKNVLRETLTRIPNQGSFKLENILKSTYFFS